MPNRLQGPRLGGEGYALGVEDVKGRPRAEFRDERFAKAIEQSHRVVWERAVRCPCAPLNSQTQQPDPSHELCGGTGWQYVTPAPDDFDREMQDALVGELTPYQRRLARQGSPIFALVTTFSSDMQAYTQLGSWVFGSARITTRAGNRLGYWDRITLIDGVMTYSEVVTIAANARDVATRYPVETLNSCIRADGSVLELGGDIELDDEGNLRLASATTRDLRLGVQYLTAPRFRVVEWPNTFRQLMRSQKVDNVTPAGMPTDLPNLGMMRLEHLVESGSEATAP